MMQPIVDEIIKQTLAWGVGTFLAAVIAACGVGGIIWRKLNANKLQDDLIAKQDRLLMKMACHQLQLSCQRAMDKGCITLSAFQEIQELYDYYAANGGNGTGKAIFEKMKREVEIREDCD